MSCVSSLSIGSLPIAGGAAAAGIAAAESAKSAIAGIGAAESTGTATAPGAARHHITDRKSTRLNSSHLGISYAVFCLKKNYNDKQLHHCGYKAPAQNSTMFRYLQP